MSRKSMSALVAGLALASPAFAFSQSAGVEGRGGTPIGHEYLTVRAALEVLGEAPLAADDPRRTDQNLKAHLAAAAHPNIPAAVAQRIKSQPAPEGTLRYGARHWAVLSAVFGQRWVDIAGTNFIHAKASAAMGMPDCFDAIAQTYDSVQYDHFNRSHDDVGAAGAIHAAQQAAARFKRYFVNAAKAREDVITAIDGGMNQGRHRSLRPYFLFGRALHLFQDSFSPEHAPRDPASKFHRILGVTTYVCSNQADQHTHHPPVAIAGSNQTGDIIWRHMDGDESIRNLREIGFVALEASKDLWAAFFRVMSLPHDQREAAAAREADLLIKEYLSFDKRAVDQFYAGRLGTKPQSVVNDQAKCETDLGAFPGHGVHLRDKNTNDRAICIYNIRAVKGFEEKDPFLGIPYVWEWSGPEWREPPKGYLGYDPSKEAATVMQLKHVLAEHAENLKKGVQHARQQAMQRARQAEEAGKHVAAHAAESAHHAAQSAKNAVHKIASRFGFPHL